MEAPKFVSEYPFPPPYYKEVNTIPPPIPSIIREPFNGIVLPKIPDEFDTDKNYKETFHRLLQSSLNEMLALVAESVSSGDVIEKKVVSLNETLNELYKNISEYRKHHAREVLCKEIAKQLEELQDMDQTLARVIEEAEIGLRAIK